MADQTIPTIFALSTAPGRAGIAVVRVSGPAAGLVLNVMAPPRAKPRVAAGRSIVHPRTGEPLDRAIVIWFPGPASETGEDVAELHLHGGRAVVRAVLGALAEVPGLRLAEAGEFTRRAFLNGKLDLLQVEGLADLVDAETEAQRRQALRQAQGAASAIYEGWRLTLIEAKGLVEAAIDFCDEADVGATTFDQARSIATTLAAAIRHHLDDGHRGEIVREGFRVALTGAPNVGKSSLLNALARRDAAIVSEEAGTTRDVIEVRLDLAGLAVVVSDTAGIREAAGAVESEGIRRSIRTAEAADLVIWLMDADEPNAPLPPELQAIADRILLVMNKVDLLPGGGPPTLPDDMIAISAKTGVGLRELAARLAAIAAGRAGDGHEPAVTQARHRRLLEEVLDGLESFLGSSADDIELRAEDLRKAADAIGRITGRIDVEDVLDQIFGRFCIGK